MSWQPPGPIVVPVDFSGEEVSAVQAALDIADDPARIHLLHVLYPLDAVSPGVVWGDVTDEKREAVTREHFDKLFERHGWSGMPTRILFGNPALEVTKYADKHEAGLIVVPSHGYEGMKRILLGSVAERIIRYAHCSVLVTRRSDAE